MQKNLTPMNEKEPRSVGWKYTLKTDMCIILTVLHVICNVLADTRNTGDPSDIDLDVKPLSILR
jgi:hypothetical protein